MNINFEGKIIEIPGVYVATEIAESGAPSFNPFNIPVVVGEHFMGPVYDPATTDIVGMIPFWSSPSNAAKIYGENNIVTVLRQIQLKSPSPVLVLGVGNLTKASFILKDETAPTPVDVVTLTTRNGGNPQNAIAVSLNKVGSVKTLTITPPMLVKKLTSDAASGAKTIRLNNVSGLYAGKTLYIAKATGAPVLVTIDSVDETTKTITLTAGLPAAYSTANFSYIFDKDLSNQEKVQFDTMTLEQFVAWINTNSKHFTAAIIDNATTAPKEFSATTDFFISTMSTNTTAGTVTLATNTALDDAAWLEIADSDFFKLVDDYYTATKLKIRHVLLVTPSSVIHGYFKTTAQVMRAASFPIMLWSGSEAGDHTNAESNAAHPIARAKALNSDDFVLAGDGKDGLAAYLSLAPRALGLVLANVTNHNLTNDNVDATKSEKNFGPSSQTELTRWLKAGVLCTRSTPEGFKIVQGVTTYQDQTKQWNKEEKKTFLIMNRQLADEWNTDVLNQFGDLSGSDFVDKDVLSARAVSFINEKVRVGKATNETYLDGIVKVSGGFQVNFNVKFPDANDFILIKTTINAN